MIGDRLMLRKGYRGFVQSSEMEQCVNDEISSNNLIGAGFKEKYCVLKVLQDENWEMDT